MKTVKILFATAALCALPALQTAQAAAATYPFVVGCNDGALVEVWKTAYLDPGAFYMHSLSEDKHPGCVVADFDPDWHADLPRVVHNNVDTDPDELEAIMVWCSMVDCG